MISFCNNIIMKYFVEVFDNNSANYCQICQMNFYDVSMEVCSKKKNERMEKKI